MHSDDSRAYANFLHYKYNMLIAYLLRGQARQTAQSSELFRRYTVNRFPEHDFDTHIYTWNHTNASNQGLPTDRTYTESMVLKRSLIDQYNPTTITIGNNSHETLYSEREIGVLNQIIADLRGQDQLYNYYKDSERKPDLIVDTRPEMFHWIETDYYEDTVNTLNDSPNSVLVNKLKLTDNLRYTSDYTFIYNWNTLVEMCSSDSNTRLNTGLNSFPYSINNSDHYISHVLYPYIVYSTQTLLDTGQIEPPQTVLNTHYTKHEIFHSVPSNSIYYSYSKAQ